MSAPTEDQRALAKKIANSYTDAEVIALTGDWRPLRIPPVLEFVHHTLIVEKESGRLIPFALWPAQEEALQVIMSAERLVMPKGRQVGATTLELAAMLYAGTFFANRLFLIARQSDSYAQDAIQRLQILAGYDPTSEGSNLRVLSESPLPAAWRPRIIAKSARSLRLANGSTFKALTASQSIARGLAGYGALADEFAFWLHPAPQLAALEASCARLHVVSTGNGEDDVFHRLWLNAVAGRGAYRPLFISSDADPRRDDDWRRLNVEEAADPQSARREHARTPEDAFRAPEGVFFECFSRERNVVEMEPVHNWPTVRSVDFGFHHPACLWVQTSPAGQPYVVGEYVPAFGERSAGLRTSDFAGGIMAKELEWNLAVPPSRTYGDPAGKGVDPQTGQSEVDVLQRAGMAFTAQPSSVRDGCVRVIDLLSEPNLPLMISTACLHLISAIASVSPDRSHPDVYDQAPNSPYQHVLDALRYWAVNATSAVYDYEVPEPSPGPSSGMWGRIW